MWSIIQRELREQARLASNYWLRLLGAMVLLVLFWLVWRSEIARSIPNGRGYFVGLNRLLFLTLWLVGPVLTADCLSREKREGTLGLLFLTPLSALAIVLGKSFVSGLRAGSVLLAAIPILVIPLLLGGVNWPDAVRMGLLHCAALGLALSAGLVASSCTTHWLRARLLALVLAVLAAGTFLLLHTGLTSMAVWLTDPAVVPAQPLAQIFARQFETFWFRSSLMLRNAAYFWRDFGLGSSGWYSVRFAALVFAAAGILVLGSVGLATRVMQRTWQAAPPSPAWQKRIRFFTDVRVPQSWFRRWMRRLLDFNPIWWRHSSTWSARVTTLGWLGLTLGLLTAAFSGLGLAATQANWVLEKLLLVGVAFSAAASFRQERESGALELLLVTGLEPAQMLRGRLLALAVQVGPAVLLVWGLPVVLALAGGVPWVPESFWGLPWLLATALLGMALSLSRFSFLTAFLLAAVAHHVPSFLQLALGWLGEWGGRGLAWLGHLNRAAPGSPRPPFEGLRFVFELALLMPVAVQSWRRAVGSLVHRTFLVPGAAPGRRGPSSPKPVEPPRP